jgi:hypothetical protein
VHPVGFVFHSMYVQFFFFLVLLLVGSIAVLCISLPTSTELVSHCGTL